MELEPINYRANQTVSFNFYAMGEGNPFKPMSTNYAANKGFRSTSNDIFDRNYLNMNENISDNKLFENLLSEIGINFENEIKSKIKELNEIFNKNVEINQDLVKLISLMFENYHNTIDKTPNYNIIH